MLSGAPREGWIDGILEAAALDDRILLLDADVSRSIGGERFAAEFPGRAINLGISEQDMMAEAAGLALAGFTPFVETYAVFGAGRGWEQIRASICHMALPVRIGGAHAGLSAGPDGATHQALEDLALMRVLPGMTVLAPADRAQTRAAALAAASVPGPAYVRFGRNPVPALYGEDCRVEPGGADVLREGGDLLLVSAGLCLHACLEACGILGRRGIAACLVNAYSVKPLAEELICGLAASCGSVLVVSDHQDAGGLFGAVAECLSRRCPVPAAPLGVGDRFGTSGPPEALPGLLGLSAESVATAAASLAGGAH
jgi:transketolase